MIVTACLNARSAGSGKSHLLVACITLLSTLLDTSRAAADRKPQVLLASATNVAVDNVLLGLQTSGFTDFCRVGSVKKIAKPVGALTASQHPRAFALFASSDRPHYCHWCCFQLLPLVAHAAGAETTRAISDLKFMLACDSSRSMTSSDRQSVTDALSKLEQKQDRAGELITRRVVGVTCAAASFPILQSRCVASSCSFALC